MSEDKDERRRRLNRERQRRYRARNRAVEERSAVVSVLDREGASVAEAVRDELATIPAASSRPGVVATLSRLAAVLDDPGLAHHAASAARALLAGLDGLRDEPLKGESTLSRLRADHALGRVSRGA